MWTDTHTHTHITHITHIYHKSLAILYVLKIPPPPLSFIKKQKTESFYANHARSYVCKYTSAIMHNSTQSQAAKQIR